MEELLTRYLSHCQLCPRRCGINRMAGELGFCGAGKQLKVGRAALHFWEEPCISGKKGSGTVFFSHCTLRCVYCQNHSLSFQSSGRELSISRLGDIFLELEGQGAENINLVTPTHYLPQIVLALQLAKKSGLSIPVVYNTSGYELPESLNLLDGLVDIFLPDFKYHSPELGRRYSFAGDYLPHVVAAIDQMIRLVGKPKFSHNEMMGKGVIIRHLMLPGQIEDTKNIIKLIHSRWGDQVYLSLMNQYTPRPGQLAEFQELNCQLDPLDYDDAVSYALSLGVRQGFVQEGGAASESFIPSFDGEGVLSGS